MLHAGFLLGLFFSSEGSDICLQNISVNFHQTTLHYIPEDRTHHNHHYENLKSYKGKPDINVDSEHPSNHLECSEQFCTADIMEVIARGTN
jgi:hypothetical protein